MKWKIAVNTASQLIGKIIASGATFIISFVVARQLGAAGYGDFTKITTYVSLFFLLADFGLNAAFLQGHGSNGSKRGSDGWATLFGIRLLGSIALIFFSLAILSLLPQSTTQGYTPLVRFGIILFAPAILFQALITTANAVFQKHLRYDLATIALGVGSTVSVGVIFFSLMATPLSSLVSPIIGLLIGTVMTALVALFFVSQLHVPLRPSFAIAPMTALLVSSLPLGLTLLLNVVYFRLDSFVLTLTRSTVEVGIYGLAYKVFEVAIVLPTFFMNAVYPLLLKQQNKELGINNGFKKILRISSLFLILSSLFLLLVLWFAAPLLSYIRTDFMASIAPLRVLALGLPFFFLTSLTMWTLIALKRQWWLLGIYGTSMVASLVLNIWLVPVYGYMAAAWITVFGEGLVLVLSSLTLLGTLRGKKGEV